MQVVDISTLHLTAKYIFKLIILYLYRYKICLITFCADYVISFIEIISHQHLILEGENK